MDRAFHAKQTWFWLFKDEIMMESVVQSLEGGRMRDSGHTIAEVRCPE